MTKKKTIVKPIAYKQVLKNVEAYKKDVAKGNAIPSKSFEAKAEQLNKYFTKKGTLRKGLSQKKIKEMNELLKDIKSSRSYTKKGRDKSYLASKKNNTYENRQEFQRSVKYFGEDIFETLSNRGYLDSTQIVQLAKDTEDFNEEDITKFLDFVESQIKDSVTSETLNKLGVVEQDDTFKLIQTYKYIFDRGYQVEPLMDLIKRDRRTGRGSFDVTNVEFNQIDSYNNIAQFMQNNHISYTRIKNLANRLNKQVSELIESDLNKLS